MNNVSNETLEIAVEAGLAKPSKVEGLFTAVRTSPVKSAVVAVVATGVVAGALYGIKKLRNSTDVAKDSE